MRGEIEPMRGEIEKNIRKLRNLENSNFLFGQRGYPIQPMEGGVPPSSQQKGGKQTLF